MLITSKNLQREVSVTIIRKNTEKTELMLKTFQRTISSSKVTGVGKLGAKIKFDEKDMDTSRKIVDVMKDVNIDEEDKIVLVTRKNGLVESSVACDRPQLEKFLLAV
ncbi:MAG: hypothetical protein WC849_01130 [Candidatus Paceibacterota bacterium]